HVVAHGEAQLWGFIGLFVAGIALRFLPMGSGKSRPGLVFSRLLLAAFLSGVVGGFLWALAPSGAGWLGPLSGVALLVATLLFLGFLFRQLVGNLRTTWGRLILAAGIWLFFWAAVTFVLRFRMSAEGP